MSPFRPRTIPGRRRGDARKFLISHNFVPRRQAIAVKKELPVEFDLGLLACFDPNPIDSESYQSVARYSSSTFDQTLTVRLAGRTRSKS